MASARDFTIAVCGLAVMGAAVMGLAEIGARAGPYESPLEPVFFALGMTGEYETRAATGTRGPDGACLPVPVPVEPCAPAATALRLSVRGLPSLPPGLHYPVFLIGDAPVAFGTLAAAAERHTLDAERDVVFSSPPRLVVALSDDPEAATPAPFVVVDAALPAAGEGATAPLDLTPRAQIGNGSGSVRTNEIGGFTVSTTAVATLHAAPAPAGWTYRAWFEARDSTEVRVDLGTFETDADGSTATLGARIERLRLEDQGRFLVTVQPAGSPGPGLSAYDAALPSA